MSGTRQVKKIVTREWRTALVRVCTLVVPVLLAGCSGGDASDGNVPVITGEYPLAWVERPLARDEAGVLLPDDLADPVAFRPGARLVVKDQSTPAAAERVATDAAFPGNAPYDVRDVTASFDGERLLFALRAPEIEDAEVQPTWNIWEYDIRRRALRRVIGPDIVAEEGDDIMPAYLPDGRIVFASTRQRTSRAVMVDEGRPQYAVRDFSGQRDALMLHVMNADGTDIRQLTFGYGHDLWPMPMDDGHVLFVRHEVLGGQAGMHFYRVRPDGRGLQPLFGLHSHEFPDGSRVEFSRPRPLDDGRILALLRTRETARYPVLPVAVDIAAFYERRLRLDGARGDDALESLVAGRFPLEDGIDATGRHADAVPLGDGSRRLLVSWSTCRVQRRGDADPSRLRPCTPERLADDAWQEADPLYGVFVYDPVNEARLPVMVPREGYMYTDLAIAVPRRLPGYLPDGVPGADLDASLVEANLGILDIRSLHDLDGRYDRAGARARTLEELRDPLQTTAAERPLRFLRLEKQVPIPSPQVRAFRATAFGVSAANGMREILGYVPVEPDGSVRVKVPAGVTFGFSVVDGEGRRVGGHHDVALQLMPGEERHCSGCHEGTVRRPHGRLDAGPPPVNAGAETTGAPFPGTRPHLQARIGETMAQLLARRGGTPALSPDLDFRDRWTDPAQRTPDPGLLWRYLDLATPPPATPACLASWQATCRAAIHYEAHIHPLWQRDRRTLAADGTTVLADYTCNGCHAPRDANGLAQVPAAQLDLSDGASPDVADHFNSYRELLAGDTEQELVGGALVERLVQALGPDGRPLFERNGDGSLVLDGNGNPVPVLVPVSVAAPMSAAGSSASARFFAPFAAGGTHEGWLSGAELRLLREWLDIGAQYFNDPFLAPEA